MGFRVPEGRLPEDGQALFAASLLEQVQRLNGGIDFGHAVANAVQNLATHGFPPGQAGTLLSSHFGGLAGFFAKEPRVQVEQAQALWGQDDESIFAYAKERSSSWTNFFTAGACEPPIYAAHALDLPAFQMFAVSTHSYSDEIFAVLLHVLHERGAGGTAIGERAAESLGSVLLDACRDLEAPSLSNVARVGALAQTISSVRRQAALQYLAQEQLPSTSGAPPSFAVPLPVTEAAVHRTLAKIGDPQDAEIRRCREVITQDLAMIRRELVTGVAALEQATAACLHPPQSLQVDSTPTYRRPVYAQRLAHFRLHNVVFAFPEADSGGELAARLEAVQHSLDKLDGEILRALTRGGSSTRWSDTPTGGDEFWSRLWARFSRKWRL